MLRIEHLTKTYGEKKAVDDLSLHILPGEIYGFIGHNGAGKTTTIKACCGILNFDAGEIYVDGLSVREKPVECKSRLAYIPDNPDLYEFLSGIKYLNFIADVFGVTQADREARIKKYAGTFDLTGDLAQPISSYSHGMRMRKSGPQNSAITWRQTPQGGNRPVTTPSLPPTTAMASKSRSPSYTALKIAFRSAQMVGVNEAFSMLQPW